MHVKFMSYKIDKIISEELLRNLFSIYGEVCDTTIKQVSIDKVRNGQPSTLLARVCCNRVLHDCGVAL
jgi:RNA recognition motif-containing protein